MKGCCGINRGECVERMVKLKDSHWLDIRDFTALGKIADESGYRLHNTPTRRR
jgi:hypothetical protein